MAGFVNHHSFLIFGGMFMLIWAGALLTRRARRGWLVWTLAGLLLGAGWFLLRTGVEQQPRTLTEIQAALSTGQPVLVEIYSDY